MRSMTFILVGEEEVFGRSGEIFNVNFVNQYLGILLTFVMFRKKERKKSAITF